MAKSFLSKATIALAAAFMLVGMAASEGLTEPGACGFDPEHGSVAANDESTPVWSSAGRQVLLTGKVVCVGCTLEEARKARPDVQDTHLYEVTYDQGQMVTELHWINNPWWRDRLVSPHKVRLRADDAVIQQILAGGGEAKELQATGLVSHLGTLHLGDVRVCN